jgi:hypothetical protein
MEAAVTSRMEGIRPPRCWPVGPQRGESPGLRRGHLLPSRGTALRAKQLCHTQNKARSLLLYPRQCGILLPQLQHRNQGKKGAAAAE